MTNREWLLNKMQSMSDEELEEIVILDCNSWVSEYKHCGEKNCQNCQRDWLKQEHKEKITLSEAERIILENIDKEYKWIARDKFEDTLFLYEDKPNKNENNNWVNDERNYALDLFNHLFQFITWQDDEPYNIEKLLKGE